ncbi:MAG TPA: hypothetical protein VMQ63_00970 [Stellaceae bacterium]|nr:hypothetical protein [Stellaceae bacterium]
MQFNVDAEIVGVELELVAGRQTTLLVDVELQSRDRPVDGELPVPVAIRMGVEKDQALLPTSMCF